MTDPQEKVYQVKELGEISGGLYRIPFSEILCSFSFAGDLGEDSTNSSSVWEKSPNLQKDLFWFACSVAGLSR